MAYTQQSNDKGVWGEFFLRESSPTMMTLTTGRRQQQQQQELTLPIKLYTKKLNLFWVN